MDEDSTESKVDDLLHYVMQLVERQKEEVRSVYVFMCAERINTGAFRNLIKTGTLHISCCVCVCVCVDRMNTGAFRNVTKNKSYSYHIQRWWVCVCELGIFQEICVNNI